MAGGRKKRKKGVTITSEEGRAARLRCGRVQEPAHVRDVAGSNISAIKEVRI